MQGIAGNPLWEHMTDARTASTWSSVSPAGPAPRLMKTLGLEVNNDSRQVLMSGDPCACNVSHCSQHPCCY